MRTVLATGFDRALEKALSRSTLGLVERASMRRELRGQWVSVYSDAVHQYADGHSSFADAPAVMEDDRPFLDWLFKLLESGELQEFMQFLVTEFLPKLFSAIVAMIVAITAI